MSHFAKVVNGVVESVIVAEQSFIDTGLVGEPSLYVQTSYNTHGGVHANGGTPLRMNFAGQGYTYDGTGFAAPQPYASWVLDTATYLWNAPVSMPTDGKIYLWDEATVNWVEAPTPTTPVVSAP